MSRYHGLNLSRRRGNAIREALAAAGIVERITISTRSGQVVLYRLTDFGRTVCSSNRVDPGPKPRESLEHMFWLRKAAGHFERKGYDVSCEHPVKGNGAIDVLAEKPGERIAIEVETGKSNIKTNLKKVTDAGFDKIVLVATSPGAVTACQRAADAFFLADVGSFANTWPVSSNLAMWPFRILWALARSCAIFSVR